MIKIKVLVFNPFQENTYLLYDQTKECVIIDPGCYGASEEKALMELIKREELNPVACLNTHTHIDHVLGNDFVYQTFGLKPIIHRAGLQILESSPEQGQIWGIEINNSVLPGAFIDDGSIVSFGESQLETRYTPGHADGSVCLVSHEGRFVITGDVLFSGSIGRTDFPTGSFALLENSIRTKLYILPDDYLVYPGHGPATTIGEEKSGNFFVKW